MKTIIKIIYIAFGLIVAVILALGMYTSFASQNYTNLLKSAVTKADQTENYLEADYTDIARCFSIFSTPLEDSPSLVYAEESGKNITFIYETVNQHVAKYKEDGTEIETTKIEDVYLVVILHPNFYYNTLSDKTNPSGFKFVGTNGETFDYLFNLSSSCNPDDYKDSPTSEKDYVLYGGRTLLDTYREEYDLIFFPLSKSTVKCIEEELDSNIQGFNIVDNESNNVYKNSDVIDFSFDYNSEFFTEMSDFVTYYNIYQDSKNGVGDYTEDEANAASKYVSTFTSDPTDILPDFNTKYVQGYPYESVYTGADMVMKTIGIIALFVFAAALVYILLFHFQTIKKFVRKFSKKEEPERKAPNIRPQTQVTISKSKVKKEPRADMVKKDLEKTIEETKVEANEAEEKNLTEEVVEDANLAKEIKETEVEKSTSETEKISTEEPSIEDLENNSNTVEE